MIFKKLIRAVLGCGGGGRGEEEIKGEFHFLQIALFMAFPAVDQ